MAISLEFIVTNGFFIPHAQSRAAVKTGPLSWFGIGNYITPIPEIHISGRVSQTDNGFFCTIRRWAFYSTFLLQNWKNE